MVQWHLTHEPPRILQGVYAWGPMVVLGYKANRTLAPQKALSGGISRSFLEPIGRSWSHFVGIYRQKLTRSLLTLRYPHEGPCVATTLRPSSTN